MRASVEEVKENERKGMEEKVGRRTKEREEDGTSKGNCCSPTDPDDSWSNYARVHAAGEGNVATSESDISERRLRDYAGRGFV